MATHHFKLKRRAITYAEDARKAGLIAVIANTKNGWTVYVYRKEGK